MVAFDVVDHLNQRLVLVGCPVQDEGSCMLQNDPPLPVAVHLGGELSEKGVRRIGQYGEGTG